jgi:hypothetical protein
MASSGGGPTFNMEGQLVGRDQTIVGTVSGDFNIGTQTTKTDMGKSISSLRAEIANLQGLPADVRKQINDALDTASTVSPSPAHVDVKTKLDHAGNALAGAAAQLEGADDVVNKALKLAKTIFSIGKWVIAAVIT